MVRAKILSKVISLSTETRLPLWEILLTQKEKEIDAKGMAIARGFINMLSWADRSLLMDGRSMSDIKQGVTLEVFGEGWSLGPTKRKATAKPVDSLWTTLGGYFNYLMKKGTKSECRIIRWRHHRSYS